jgi:branched-chain amino acid transport system permease protein
MLTRAPGVRWVLGAGTLVQAALGLGAALLLWAVLNAALPHGVPPGIILSGLVFGAINSLIAVSIVLVYRANRVVNFAAAEFGAVAAVVAIELHIQVHLDYFLSVLTGLVLAAVLGAAIELSILRRFAKAPRLIVAVVTIGLAQVLNGASVVIPSAWSSHGNAGSFSTPFTAHFFVSPVLFNGNYLVAMVVAPVMLVGLTWFLRATHYGVAIRASADNGDRAQLLGVPVARLSTIIWTLTGLLSATAVLLRVPIVGFASFTSVSTGGAPLLLQTLAAAVVGGMSNLPVTVLAALGLGVVDQLTGWTLHDGTYNYVALLGVILLMLLLRRRAFSRAADIAVSTWQAIRPVRPVPPELVNLRAVKVGRVALSLVLLASAVVLAYVLPPARTQLMALIAIYAIVGCSLVVLTGFAGHISLGQVGFMGLGSAITGVMVVHGFDMFLALAAGAAAASLAAFVVGIPALRISGPFLAVTTLAFAVTAAAYFLNPLYFPWLKPTDELPHLSIFGRIPLDSDRSTYLLCLFALVVVLTAVRGLRASHAGRAMVAGQENRLAAQSFAIDTTRTHLVAFAVSGAIAGLAGGLFVVQQGAYNAGTFNAEQGLQFFTMVVIGGLGSLPGAVLGAVYVYGTQYFLPPGWSLLATGSGIVALLMFFPGGLGDLVYRGRDAALRFLATRRGLVVPSLLADRSVEPVEEAMPVPLGLLREADVGA